MKRVALLLAGLTLGTTSPVMAAAWAPGGAMAIAVRGLQLAQNDDRRDRRPPARPEREERGDPRGQREAPPQQQREGPQQREAPPQQRDPRYSPARQPDVRQAPERDPREAYDRRGPVRPQAPVAPPVYAPPRLSEQSAIGAVRQRFGGRLMDSVPVMRNGRPYYSVRVQTRDGRLVDYLVDGTTGDISRGGG